MTQDELDKLLLGAEETHAVEFKGPMSWDHNSLVKDILAFSNTLDGGVIIFGVEDEGPVPVGISPDQAATFDLEVMRDKVANYADPHVDFRCDVLEASDGLTYAVITVSPFDDVPVICRKGGTEVVLGTIYTRTRAGRPQSAPVKTSSELRALIERAIVNRHRALRHIGFEVQAGEAVDYDSELEGL